MLSKKLFMMGSFLGFSFLIEGVIKNIIFDLGGVILKEGPAYFVHGKPHLSNALKSEAWKNWLRGYISKNDVINELSHSFKKEDIEWIINKTLEPKRPFIEKTLSIIQQLKEKGYKLFILSNFSAEAYEIFVAQNTFFNYFDAKMFSFQVGAIKPEPEIYKKLLEKHGLIADECLFIDDMEKNVRAAQQIGIHALIFKEECIEATLLEFIKPN